MKFSLASLRQIGVGALRVTFTGAPVAQDSSATNDALNLNNYALVGPADNYVTSTSKVEGDPNSIDLYLASSLVLGTWTVYVSNVKDLAGAVIVAPTSLSVLVASLTPADPLGHGAVNEEYTNILRRFLNPALKGKGWDSMIAALATADQRNADNARLAFDQLFLSTASGVYLDRRASDEGIERPRGVNMSDDLFRKLALAQRNGKLTQKALLDVLEVFYGRDATRASSDTANAETYELQDGDELAILFEERNVVTVTFERTHFSHIEAATAAEVAAAITRACRDAGNEGFAVSFPDSITGEDKVRIYSGTLGLTSSVRIIGGRANLVLLFPTPLFDSFSSATWDVDFSPDTQGNLRFTMTAGSYDLLQVRRGDLVYIYGEEFADVANGTYEIQAIFVTDTDQWFEITNPLGEEASGISQDNFNSLVFFRPKRKTIYDNARRVIVCENDGYLDVIIPATTEVVDRGPGLAAYLNVSDEIEVTSLIRKADGIVTVTTTFPHGLEEGNQVIVDNVLPTGSAPSNIGGTPSGDISGGIATGTSDASIASSLGYAQTFQGIHYKALTLPTGEVMIVSGQTQSGPSTFAPITDVFVFSKTGEAILGNGGKQESYLWQAFPKTYTVEQRSTAASVLEDGRVLVTGGADGDDVSGTSTSAWDLFEYVSTAVNQTSGNLGYAVASHAQATIDGGAIISGGWSTPGNGITGALKFDIITSAWSFAASMNQGRMHHGLIELSTGKVLAVGGQYTTSVYLPYCELYDVDLNSWTNTGSMTYARANFALVELPDGRIMVLGGTGYNPTRTTTPSTLSSCEVYDPATGLWAPMPSMMIARATPSAMYVASLNAVIVAGGNFVEKFDLTTQKWTRIPVLPSNLTGNVASLVSEQTVLISGGSNGTTTEKTNWVLVPGADSRWNGAGLNTIARVASVPTSSSFTYQTEELNTYIVSASGVKVTPMAAPEAPEGIPGPFSYEVKTGFSITASNAVTDQAFNRGGHYSALHLDTGTNPEPALDFPDEEGFIVFNFGYRNQVGPIKYLGRLSTEELLLDAGASFPSTLPAGATVRLLTSREPFEPDASHLVGNFYVTGIAAGRETARRIIDDITAAGKQVLVTIIYPGDRGLGAAGFPARSNYKLSDKVAVWGGDDLAAEIPAARSGQ